jgi:tetratricopeptide (TPR) repeat protein
VIITVADTESPDDLPRQITMITASLRGPATPEVAEQIAAARGRWPKSLGLILLQGTWLEKVARPDEAEASYREAQAAHPNNPWPAYRLTELYLSQRRADDAARIFADSVWRSTLPEAARGALLSRVTAALIDLSHRRIFLQGLLRGTADDRLVLAKLAALSLRQRDRLEAGRLLDLARQYGPLPPECQMLWIELLITAKRFDEAFDLAMELRAKHPERSEYMGRAILAAHFSGRTPQLIELLQEAMTRWPKDWMILFRYNRCTCPMAADRALFELISAQATAANDQRWQFQYAIACLRHDRTDTARTILEPIRADSPVASMALPLRAALAAHTSATWQGGRGVVNDVEQDVQLVRVAQPRATLVLLTGVVGGLGYLPVSHVDGLLARVAVNVLYLRDVSNRAFTRGVRSMGSDQTSMVAALAKICGSLAVPVITFGSSIGGVAAIRTAALLGAHAAISFAGPIHLGIDTAEDGPVTSGSGGPRTNILSQFARTDMSLIELIRSVPGTRFHQCFGTDFAPDVANAELIRPLPNVVLHPFVGCADHFVIEHMIADGSFFDVIERAITMPPPDAA